MTSMASAAEQLAASINFGAFAKATDLKNRIWFTLGALVIYRLGTYIPLPGIDARILAESLQGSHGAAVAAPGLFFRATTVITLTGGTVFLMWLGEQITQRGIGNGISLIIMAGIVANLPHAFAATLELGRTGAISTVFIIIFLLMSVAVVGVIVFMERAQRRILVQYPKRQQGNRMFGGEASHLPLKLNTSGVIPPIFASSLLLLPATFAGFSTSQTGILADIGTYM